MEQQTGTCNSILPAQKCIAKRRRDLADHELLAAILGTGTKNRNVLSLAADIIGLFGGLAKVHTAGLGAIANTGRRHDEGCPRAGRVRTWTTAALQQRGQHHHARLTREGMAALPGNRHAKQGKFRVITLNNKNHVIKEHRFHGNHFRGDHSSAGNIQGSHPRGGRIDNRRPQPSIGRAHTVPQRISPQRNASGMPAIIGIELLDHVIICATSYLSMKEAGYL